MKTLALGTVLVASLTMSLSASDTANPVQAQLVSEVSSIGPATSFCVAVVLTMAPEWHTYWQNPGDAGLATKVEWDLPEGFIAGPLQWPCPSYMTDEAGECFVYGNEVWLLTDIQTPTALPPSSNVTVGCSITWLGCHNVCMPGRTNLALALLVSEQSVPDPEQTDAFAAARQCLPQKQPTWTIFQAAPGAPDRISVTVRLLRQDLGTIQTLRFFPIEPTELRQIAAETQAGPDGPMDVWILDLKTPPLAPSVGNRLSGILQINGKSDGAVFVDLPLLANPPTFNPPLELP